MKSESIVEVKKQRLKALVNGHTNCESQEIQEDSLRLDKTMNQPQVIKVQP